MRARNKKHCAERLAACNEILIRSPEDIKIMPYGVELGCGKGAFITELAKRNTDRNYLAVEQTRMLPSSQSKKSWRQKY